MIVENKSILVRRLRGISIITLFFVSILFTQCSTAVQNDTNVTPNTISKNTIQDKESTAIIQFQPPLVIHIDSCLKPQVIAIPKNKGDFYLVEYTDRTNAINLEPPKIIDASFNSFMQTYNTEQGLALSSISEGSTSSFCDRQGNLWFGTQGGGVSRFDGKTFTNFTMDNGLAGNMVQSIAEDSKGNLWFGTDGGGISIFDGKKFSNLTTEQGLLGNTVNCIIADKKGNIWVATSFGGLSCFNGSTITNYTTSNGLSDNTVYSIYEDKLGSIWIGTRNGLCFYDGKTFSNFTTEQGLAGNFVNCIAQDNLGFLWIGTWGNGVSCYDGKKFTNYSVNNGLAGNSISNIKVDKGGTLWFGTNGGISSFNPSKERKMGLITFTNFTTAQGLTNNIVTSITEDKIGNLWFGTNGGGISCYTGSGFINYGESQGLASSLVFSIAEDKSGNYWFGSYENGVSCFDGKKFTHFTTQQGLINDAVNCIYEDNLSNIWFGTNEGVSCFNGYSFTNLNHNQGLVGQVVNSITQDRNGNLWFGTVNGVSKYNGKCFTNFGMEQGLVNNRVYSIKEDKTGKIWIATDGGISCFNGKSFDNFTTPQGLVDDRVYSIAIDSMGNLWFGTYKGTSRYDGNSFCNFTTAEGLANNSVMAVVQDPKGIVWMGTNKGFSGLSFQEIKSTSNTRLAQRNGEKEDTIIPAGFLNADNQKLKNYKPVWEIYNNQTGYPIKDVNGGSNNGAMICDSKGIIWAGTGDVKTGLVRFDYNAVLKSSEPPIIVLTSIKINNENICWHNLQSLKTSEKRTHDSLEIINEEHLTFGKILNHEERIAMQLKFSGVKFDSISPFYPLPQPLVLPYSQNNVTFEFNAVITSQNFRVNYQYMLEGYDENWSPVTDIASASFGNIFEGVYNFKVKACSPNGIWSEPISYTFRVLPPWWRTWWMYCIYVATLLTAIYLVFRWQTAKLTKENQLLEDKVSIRTAELYLAKEEITAQRDDIELQRDEIKAQRDIVTLQKEQIEEIHKKVSDSINYAKRIQQAMLPSEKVAESILNDHFILFKPKDVVSGDFYWATKINDWLIFTVADCTGHGVPGAFMSMLGISFLNEIVRKKEIVTASEVLEQMRSSIIEALHQTNDVDRQKDGIDIALCVLNLETLEMQFAGANIPLYIASDELKELKVIKGDKMTLAISHKMSPFNNHILHLKRGDIVYLITDGFQDQFGGPDDWKFSSKKLERLLFENHNKPMFEQKIILTKEIEDWMYYGNGINFEQTDDITILGIKI